MVIGSRIALQLKDKYAYADVLNTRSGSVPAPSIGRGMCILNEKMLEFQVAVPFARKDEIERGELMKKQLSCRVC